MNENAQKEYTARLAKALAVFCVRNTFLEDLHSGKTVISRSGDYKDVKVVTPEREIPWNDVSRISDEEMKKLMKQVVNKLYTFLMSLEDEQAMYLLLVRGQQYTYQWDEPEFLPTFLKRFVPPDEELAQLPPAADQAIVNDYDKDKIDDAVLALLYLTMHDDDTRAWKGHDWDALDRLHQKGYIGNPRNKNKSVVMTQEGRIKAQTLFHQIFGKAS